MGKRKWYFLTVLPICSLTASAYEIGVIDPDLKDPDRFDTEFGFERNHERMTALALECLYAANRDSKKIVHEPVRCENYSPDSSTYALFSASSSQLLEPARVDHAINNYLDLIKHVRFPDDPTRMLKYKGTIPKFVELVKVDCKIRKLSGPIDATTDGMLCASHYGSWQFMHAMANDDGIKASDTRKLINQWLSFTYKIASEDTEIDITEGYCDYWDKKEHTYPDLAAVMYNQGYRDKKWCESRCGSFLRCLNPFLDDLPPWTVGTTFNLYCKNPIDSGICNTYKHGPTTDSQIRKAALGSMLHLIQDSFSNAHTERIVNDRKPTVDCKPIVRYRSYTHQSSSNHGTTDKWPTFSPECENSDIYDPILASAKVIYHVHKKTKSDLFPFDLNKIFGKNPTPENKSEAGKAFE
ncbi:hypothetical protein QSV34_14490 [Porticoccus sp. W117]|uniref:hypothetical protein n=1 Tax=Porticoccus sp. W117 TaxID=3054777 RepID=UPI002597240B|nr:hypothetical protein [Porticoccus sp. W117]MDM3872558.1 hypothetical protein [Porticoccus sp. W117]